MSLRSCLSALLLLCGGSVQAQSVRWTPASESTATPATPTPFVLRRTPTGALIAGTQAGLYRSESDGPWVRATADSLRDVQAIAWATRGATLYVTTVHFGVLESADDGRSWHGAGLSGTTLQGLAALPDGALVAIDHAGAIYRQEAAGQPWTVVAGRISTTNYARPGGLVGLADGTLFSRMSNALFRSTDRGATWSDTGLRARSTVAPAANGAAYVVAFATSEGYTVQRTVDSGASWRAVGSVPRSNDYVLTAGGDELLYLGVAVGSDSGVLRSADGGSWEWTYRETAFFPPTTVLAPRSASGRLYVGSFEKGLVWLEPPYRTATSANAGFVREIGVSVMAPVGPWLFAGDQRLQRTGDGGKTWQPVAAPFEWPNVLLGLPDGRLFAGTYGAVYRSSDLGETWKAAPIPQLYSRERSVGALAQTRTGALLAGTNGGNGLGAYGDVFRSVDGGETWTLTTQAVSYAHGPVETIVQAESGSLFAGHRDGGFEGASGALARSDDDGQTWTVVRNGSARSLTPLAGGRLLVAMDDGTSGVPGVLFHADPTGTTWERLSAPPGGGPEVLRTTDGTLFRTGYGVGVRRSPDEGRTWTTVNGGLENRSVTALATGSDGRLYAGTVNGVFRTERAVVASEPEASSRASALEAPWPNPVRARAVLAFTLAADAEVDLAIHDALGRRVATVASGHFAAGRHEAPWEPGALAVGAYFVVLRNGRRVETRALSVVR